MKRIIQCPRFLKWIHNPRNDLEVIELYETCKEWNQTPSDYWFPGLGENNPEAKYLIDKHIMLRGRKIHKDNREQSKNNSVNVPNKQASDDKNIQLLQQAIEADHATNK